MSSAPAKLRTALMKVRIYTTFGTTFGGGTTFGTTFGGALILV